MSCSLALLALLLPGCALLGGGTPARYLRAVGADARRRPAPRACADPDRRAFGAQGAGRPEHRHQAGAGRHPVSQGRAMGRPAAEDRAGAAGRHVPALGPLRRRRQAGRGAGDRLSGDRRDPGLRGQRRGGKPPRSNCSCACSTTATAQVRASKTFTASAPVGGGKGNDAYVAALDAPSARPPSTSSSWTGFNHLTQPDTAGRGSARRSVCTLLDQSCDEMKKAGTCPAFSGSLSPRS